MTSDFRKGEIDWGSIQDLVFIDQDACWTTCNSHCCTHKNVDLGFTFMKNGSGMVFFEPEYEYLKKMGILQEGFEAKAKKFEFKVNDELILRFYISKCELMGKCTLPQNRPLICKLYPYIPNIDIETLQITGFSYASIPDQIWAPMKKDHACTLVREKSDEIKEQMLPALRVLLKHPYFIFYFKCAELFLKQTGEGLRRFRKENPLLSLFDFSQRWEIAFLRKETFNPDDLREEIAAAYQKIKRLFSL